MSSNYFLCPIKSIKLQYSTSNDRKLRKAANSHIRDAGNLNKLISYLNFC